jgi:peptide/nickel transport system permease protein
MTAVDPTLGPQAQAPTPTATTRRRRAVGGFLTPWWGLLALFVMIALAAPLLVPYDPVTADLSVKLQPPSSEHWFGTDSNGMDVLSRVLWATRTDFTIAFIGVALAVLVGVPLGAVGGFLGGWLDAVLNRISEILQSIPLFLFALIVFAALGNSKTVLVGVIAVVNMPLLFRLTRAVVLPMRNLDYIAAARCAGRTSPSIILRHVLPNALGPVSSQLSICCAYAIQIIAGLSFIGLGVEVPEPEWGAMIQQGAGLIMDGQWWIALFPGLAVLAAVMTFGGIGRQLAARYGN